MTLDAAAERPLQGAPPVDGWVENYALVANDPAAQINVCFYTGRQPFDLSVWHEILLVRLGDGHVLAWKSAGRSGTDDGSGGACSTFACLEPGRRWRLRFAGFAWTSDAAALAAGPLADGPWTRLELELEFTAAAPAWVLGGGDDLARAQEHSHYEQSGTLQGTVRAGDERFAFSGTGLRDHSRGPRDFRGVLDHAWVDCLFPDGRSFALYRMRLPGGADGVAAACVADASSLRHVEVVSMPVLAEADGAGYEIVLRDPAGGETFTIAAELLHEVGHVSYLTPNHMAIGASSAPEACQVVRESATRFTWDGATGFGHTQRSRAAHPPA